MTEKELKKLNRYQLLEMLIVQTERADELQARLEKAEKQLTEQKIKISSLGSVAEASVQLSGVFEAAQIAADKYIDAAKQRADEIEKKAEAKALKLLTKALEEARNIKGEQ